MKQLLEKIREWPHHKKTQTVWVIIGVVVLTLIILWLIVGNGARANPNLNFFNNFNEGFQDGKTTGKTLLETPLK
jgi:uncharacterized integral membrane protein